MYTEAIYTRYLELLREFIRIPSVSTDPAHTKDVAATAQWLHDMFDEAGFTSELITDYDNPLVLARYDVEGATQTVMIYGHYDVQPAAKEDGWESEPFELTEKDGRLIARGAIDNKGQVLVHIATVLHLIQVGALKYNVIFFIEGNEETGSPHLESFVRENINKLTSDYILVSDGEIVGEYPIIEVGFRGVMNAELRISTSHTELHSGLVGGTVPNAAHEMARFLAGLHTDLNKVMIPGFYDAVREPTPAQLDNNASIPFTEADYLKITGTKYYTTESNYDVYTQTGLRPSLEVTGLESGYIGPGYKNGVPPRAMARFNFRFVADQDPEDIAKKFKEYVASVLPSYVDHELIIDESAKPVFLDISDPIFSTVSKLLADVYGQRVINKYVGGSIPIVGTFQELLGVPQLLIPLANEDCNMHGIHENFRIDLLKKGLQFSEGFFSK
jgi:acetylornithine deacetylase/succinyl-diaminopimelate desuccinylase-like protein